MNTSLRTSFFRTMLIVFSVVALMSGSISPASAQSTEPLSPAVLTRYCEKLRTIDEKLVYDEAIIDPQFKNTKNYPDGPDGKSWRCAAKSYQEGSSSSAGCNVEVRGDISLGGAQVGTSSGCSVEIGTSEGSQTVPGLMEINIDLACGFEYGWQDKDTGLWYSLYLGDSTDWSDPYALVCVYNGPTF